MRANLIGIALGVCIVLFLWLSGIGASMVARFEPQDPFDSALQAAITCSMQRESAECVRPVVITMLALKSPAYILSVLESRLKPQQCHYVGHVLGQQLFTRTPDVEQALAQCSRTCDSACTHGVIGQAFAVALGFPDPNDTDFDLRHISPTDLQSVGKQLCISPGACHGVGHALFQTYAEFAPAFKMCRDIGGASITTCYNGVTMEYADVLSARNMRVVSDVEFPKPESFKELCAFSDTEEARACFRYFPRVVEETLKKDEVPQEEARTQTQKICESYTSTDLRIACFAGIGSHAAYAVLTDTNEAVVKCISYSTNLDQASCMLGIVTVATGDRMNAIAKFCNAQISEPMRAACYQALFYTLDSGRAEYSVPALCGAENPVCEAASSRAQIDPWSQIKKTFGGA